MDISISVKKAQFLAYPDGNREHKGIDLAQLCESIEKANLTYPVLVRFTDILRTRFDKLHNAFAQVIAETNYQGKYTSVYPIQSESAISCGFYHFTTR